MAGCSVNEGEGCKQMTDMEKTVYGDKGLEGKVKSKVSWKALGGIGLLLFASFITVIFFFSDIRVMSKEYPETKKQVQDNKTEIRVIKSGQERMIIAQNRTNDLLQQLLDEKKKNDKPKHVDTTERK